MLNTKITNCTSCANVIDLLSEIDRKLFHFSRNKYSNISLLTNLEYDEYSIGRLLRYKSILNKRLYNPNYACDYPLTAIISKIKILINK